MKQSADMSDASTPRADAIAMLRAGASVSAVKAHLESLGLDAQSTATVIASAKRAAREPESTTNGEHEVATTPAVETPSVVPNSSDSTPQPTEMSPRDEALALLRAGAAHSAVSARLASRGLDEEAIALVMTSAHQGITDGVEAIVPPVDVVATTTPCARCGTFVTVLTQRIVQGKSYCESCAARPDIDYLGAFRAARLGKRDGWAWWFGVQAIVSVVVGALSLERDPVVALIALVFAVVCALFWGGVAVARPLLVLSTLASATYGIAVGSGSGLVGVFFSLAAVRSPLSKLHFKQDVSDDELLSAWRASHDNRLALWGRGLGLVAVLSMLAWLGVARAAAFTAGLAVLGLLTSAVGLSRVDANRQPPIGQRSAAIVGLVLSGVGLLCAIVFLSTRARW